MKLSKVIQESLLLQEPEGTKGFERDSLLENVVQQPFNTKEEN